MMAPAGAASRGDGRLRLVALGLREPRKRRL